MPTLMSKIETFVVWNIIYGWDLLMKTLPFVKKHISSKRYIDISIYLFQSWNLKVSLPGISDMAVYLFPDHFLCKHKDY